MKAFPQYPVNTGGLPVANINTDNVTATVNEMLKDSRATNYDRTTYADMIQQLQAIDDRENSARRSVERMEQELAELEQKYTAKKEAVRLSKQLLGKRPGLRGDIAEMELQLTSLEEEGHLTRKALLQSRTMLAAAIRLGEEFDHKKMKRLQKEEQALAKAGL